MTEPTTTEAIDLLAGLNAAQKEAVTAGAGPILVLAGPGSGKTRVLTRRIAYLVRQAGVAPWHIMAVTFTNKAAREMEHRLQQLLEGRLRGLTVGTFHATCARILRRESKNLLGYEGDFVIFDRDDQLQVVKQALATLNLDDKKFAPARMLNGISTAKNELVTPEEYAASSYIAEVTRRVYGVYQELLVANNAMDFDDLLMNTVLLFDERPDVLQKYQEQYQQLLVDEFQDTNTTQYELLKRLAAPQNNIFVVGDSDQSIYKWRGADFRNIHRFQKQYPDARLILLEQNYRSTQIILDAAKAVIRRNVDRVDKELFTERSGGRPLEVHEAYNEGEEAEYIVDTIHSLMLKGYSPGDCAVMYRTNAQSRAIEEAFLRANMAYKLVGATRFYGRREIKDIVAYLRVVHNPADAISLNRIINTPTRGIGRKTQQALYDWARRQGLQPAEALLRLANDTDVQHDFRGRAYNVLTDFGELLHAWLTVRDDATVSEMLDLILEQTDYRSYIDDGTEDGQERWGNVMEFRNVAALADDAPLSEFLEQVALVSDVDDLEESSSAVTLLTLHAAKGLEFPIVFIAGLEEGILPHSRSMDDAEELAEERRLFYVGLTRAMDRIYLLYTFRRTVFGEASVGTPSRFLGDIPAELISGGSVSQRRQESVSRASTWNWQREPRRSVPRRSRPRRDQWQDDDGDSRITSRPLRSEKAKKPDRKPQKEKTGAEPQYRTGQKVRHAKFGDGIVIESTVTGNDEEVTVAFKKEGIKKLAASFANLEKV
ncbi:MAG: ATP-dependent helicase [Chloroflexota bacterium]